MAGLPTKPTSTASQLMPYSYGIVATNKARNSFDVEVTPTEDLQFSDGELTDQVTSFNASGVDAQGAAYQVNTNQSSTVTATWLPIGQANRMTPPDVERGEQVMLYRFANADKFYWTTLRNDLTLRRLETVIYAISATQSNGVSPDPTSTYLFGMSSHDKRIWLTTSKAQGEPYAYTMNFDLANGNFSLQDDVGNEILLDSANNTVRLQNGDGSFLELNKTVLNAQTTDAMNFQTKAFSIKTESMTTNATTASLTATTNTITAATTHNGNLAMNGNIVTAPGSSGEGDIEMAGNFTLKGNQTIEGELSAQHIVTTGIDSSGNVNAPNIH